MPKNKLIDSNNNMYLTVGYLININNIIMLMMKCLWYG